MASAHYHVRRLERIADQCGVGPRRPGTDDGAGQGVDTSTMTEYGKQQYQTAVVLQRIRSNITELDGMGEKASITKKSELSQAIRRDLDKARQESGKAKRLAKGDSEKSEYATLVQHVRKTEGLWQKRFQTQQADEDGSLVAGGPSAAGAGYGGTGVHTLDDEMSSLQQPMGANLRDDEEFQMFFRQVEQNDQLIDRHLDVISAGVQRLHDQAQTINQELKMQNQLLDETEEKASTINKKLTTVNRRLKRTIKEVQRDKLCIYLICFVLLLSLGGVIYWQISKNSEDEKK